MISSWCLNGERQRHWLLVRCLYIPICPQYKTKRSCPAVVLLIGRKVASNRYLFNVSALMQTRLRAGMFYASTFKLMCEQSFVLCRQNGMRLNTCVMGPPMFIMRKDTPTDTRPNTRTKTEKRKIGKIVVHVIQQERSLHMFFNKQYYLLASCLIFPH